MSCAQHACTPEVQINNDAVPQAGQDDAGGVRAEWQAQHAGVPLCALLLPTRQTGVLRMQAAARQRWLPRDATASPKHVGGAHEVGWRHRAGAENATALAGQAGLAGVITRALARTTQCALGCLMRCRESSTG